MLSIYPGGDLKLVKVVGAATVANVDVRPDAGFKWQILDAWFSHDDDSGSHTLYWEYYDGTNTASRNGAGYNANIICDLMSARNAAPVVINRDTYLRMRDATGLGAGHVLTAYALVLESGDYSGGG
jgi:hypothetical protein